MAAGVPVYKGRFGIAQAERLLWRAGFGPRPGEAARLAQGGMRRAVLSLTRPGAEQLVGPPPTDDKGLPIAPYDAVGHDHLWWLDRMVRSSNQLVERMTLVWHDWFATSAMGVRTQKLLLDQNQTLRTHALGSFAELLVDVTKDPAMLVWLNGDKNTRVSPNENYAREMMELFTLGANRGYTESDIREQARSLTGWRSARRKGQGYVDFHYEPRLHDDGVKTVFGRSGAFDWQDACRLCLEHPKHPSYFVRKLWSYFVPVAPSAATQRSLERIYADGRRIQPVVEAILMHPALYTGGRMVKPPVVFAAGLLRALDRGIATETWAKLAALSGQRLFYPPNVAGWDETRWLDTSTFRGRWFLATTALQPFESSAGSGSATAAALVDRAARLVGKPSLTAETRGVLLRFAKQTLPRASPAVVEVALRQLVAVSPELQTS